MFRSLTLGLAAVMLLAACSDGRDSTSPIATKPALSISDGAHSSGNQDFFFMPPIAANPSNSQFFDAGKFNGRLAPTVSICILDALTVSTCAGVVKTFAPSEISISDQQYHVNWNTKESALLLNRMYRISVLVGSKLIGYVDVDPVSNGSQLRAVNTNQYIGLVDGRTLPIKFRIEQGATCENRGDCGEATVTNTGATVVTSSGFAGAEFPQGWLPVDPRTGKPYENVVVKIERIPTGSANICHTGLNMLQFEGCYQFTTDPYVGRFAKPVVAGVCPELLPSDPRYSMLTFYHSGPNEETGATPEASAPFVNCEGFTGTPAQIGALGRVGREIFALVNHAANFLAPRSAYAIDLGVGGELIEFSRGGWVLETNIAENGGNNQTAAPGAALPNQISVLVTGHHGRPVAGVAIDFNASEGSVAAASVTTNSDGVASTTWTLGSAGGSQNAFASVAGIGDGPTVTFTATAQQVIASVSLQATRIDLGLQQSSAQVTMVQRDAAGNVIFPPGPCTWARTSNLGNLQITQTGIVSSSRPDDGVVTATCGGVVGSALVEAGDYQFTASGGATDVAGDQVAGGTEGAPDLIGVSASVAQRNITFNVDFEAGSVAGVSIHSVVSIDADQSFATGHPGLSAGGTLDNTIIGVEYILRIDNGSAVLLKYNGTPNSFSTVMSTTCTVSATPVVRRISCTVPLTALDYDEGYVNFKATAGANFPSGGNNGIRDQATNVGQAPATTSPIIG